MTTKPRRSATSRSSGAGGLWLGRMALQALSFWSSSWGLQCAGVDGGAERAEIVMIANAVQGDTLAVEKEAVISGEFNRANAERSFILVDHFAILLYGCNRQITRRILYVPQLRLGNGCRK